MAYKIYLIAGEASGDLHGSNLARELKTLSPEMKMRGWGGDKMSDSGVEIVKHYRDLAFMGFTEVLMNLRTILKNLAFCKQDILAYKPDAVVLIDYPGFNLRIAEFLHKNGIPVIYYISPQVWAWKQSRVEKIKRFVDRMFVILPFEKEFYKRFNYEVSFPGHPLLDAIDNFNKNEIQENSIIPDNCIALIPGSRKQEISKMLPVMLETVEEFREYPVVIAKAKSVEESFYRDLIGDRTILLCSEGTYPILRKARAALVTSGTATLETALFDVPQIVCYKGSAVSYQLARRLIKVKYISLVNLILDKQAVPELIQEDFSVSKTRKELNEILNNNQLRATMLSEFEDLKNKLGGTGASARAAKEMVDFVEGLTTNT